LGTRNKNSWPQGIKNMLGTRNMDTFSNKNKRDYWEQEIMGLYEVFIPNLEFLINSREVKERTN